MSKSNTFENALLLLIFNNTNIANIGDATGLRGSSTAGSLYVSLHTSDPGEAGSAVTNECADSGYARQAVARSGSGWTVSADTVTNAAAITFDTGADTPANVTHVGIVTSSSGAGTLLYSGALDTTRSFGLGADVAFAIGALSVAEG